MKWIVIKKTGKNLFEHPILQIENHAQDEKCLSLDAIGLWMSCLSHEPNWKIKIMDLVMFCASNESTVCLCLAELINAGYCERHKKGEEIEYCIYEEKLKKRRADGWFPLKIKNMSKRRRESLTVEDL